LDLTIKNENTNSENPIAFTWHRDSDSKDDGVPLEVLASMILPPAVRF